MPKSPLTLTYEITGVCPLLMHNGRLANPLDPFAKEMSKLSCKRPKVEADYEQMARLEWRGGLYLHEGKPALPGEMLEAAVCEGAKRSRKGKAAKAAVFCDQPATLSYDGPTDPDKLWDDPAFRLTCGVRVQRNRVMRTRPHFADWSARFDLTVLDEELEPESVTTFLAAAGRYVGIGDFRPKFGRFSVLRVA